MPIKPIMPLLYITNKDTLIFDSIYNAPLNINLNYLNPITLTLTQYKKIIFSDYQLSEGIK